MRRPYLLQHSLTETRCQDQSRRGATQAASGRAIISPASAGSSHIPPDALSALISDAAGWRCGSACPAAGWPAPTTPPTSTPRRTIRRPTIPWPSRWSTTAASAGAMSISAPSDTPGPLWRAHCGAPTLSAVAHVEAPRQRMVLAKHSIDGPRCGHCARPSPGADETVQSMPTGIAMPSFRRSRSASCDSARLSRTWTLSLRREVCQRDEEAWTTW